MTARTIAGRVRDDNGFFRTRQDTPISSEADPAFYAERAAEAELQTAFCEIYDRYNLTSAQGARILNLMSGAILNGMLSDMHMTNDEKTRQ